MKNLKQAFIVLFFLLAAAAFAPAARAESINEFRTAVGVKQDGLINVKETIRYDFGDSGTHHGIFRDIPTQKTNQDGKRYRMNINVSSVTDENNVPYNYMTSYTGERDDLRLKIGSANELVSGVKTYVISYEVKGALTYFSEHDELYWNMTGNSWNVPIEKASYQVDLPSSVPADRINQSCYTGATGSAASDCQVAVAGITGTGKAVQSLAPGEGLTAVIGFPPGYVARVEPEEVISFFDTAMGKLVMVFLAILAVVWYLGLPISIPFIWNFWGRDPRGAQGPVSAWFDPPKDKAGRSLTPGETGLLIDESVDMRDVFATIVHLAQRGYLKIVEKNKNDYYFVKQKEYIGDASLINFERTLLDGIFSGSTKSLNVMDAVSEVAGTLIKEKKSVLPGEVRIKTLDMGEEVSEATGMLYKEMTRTGFFPQNPNTVRIVWYVLAGIALFTGNIFLGVELFIFGRIMPRKTLFGAQQANIAKSVKNFLSTQERQLEFQAKNQMFFEKLLPYAIAFGVEKVWADRFKDIKLHNPSWYQPYNSRAFTTAYFLNSMNSSFSSFRSAATPTRSSSGFSSGFGGGGFSGGGGGGGGGGSW